MTELTLTPDQEARIAAAKHLWDLPYDGVVGTLPDWFPSADRSEFLRIRFSLLREYPPQSVLYMIQYLDGSLVFPEEVEREGFYLHIPARLRPDVWRLLNYKRAFALGPVEGLDLLLGAAIAGNARRGRKVLLGASSGGASTKKKKQAQRDSYQEYIDKLHRERPTLSHYKLSIVAGNRFSVHEKTIRRNTKNPTKD